MLTAANNAPLAASHADGLLSSDQKPALRDLLKSSQLPPQEYPRITALAENFSSRSRVEQSELISELSRFGLDSCVVLLAAQLPRALKTLEQNVADGRMDREYRKLQQGQTVFMVVERPHPGGMSRSQAAHLAALVGIASQQDGKVTIGTINSNHREVIDLELGESGGSATLGSLGIRAESYSVGEFTKRLMAGQLKDSIHNLDQDELIDLGVSLTQQTYSLSVVQGVVLEPSAYSNQGTVLVKLGDEIARYPIQDIRFLAITGVGIDLDAYAHPPEELLYRGKPVRIWDYMEGKGWLPGIMTEPDEYRGAAMIRCEDGRRLSVDPYGALLDLRDPQRLENSELLPHPMPNHSQLLCGSPVRMKCKGGGLDWGYISGLNHEKSLYEVHTERRGFSAIPFDSKEVQILPREATHPEQPEIKHGSIFTYRTADGEREVFEICGVDQDYRMIIAKARMALTSTPQFRNFTFSQFKGEDRINVYECNWEEMEQLHPGIKDAPYDAIVTYRSEGSIQRGELKSPNGLPAFALVHPSDDADPYSRLEVEYDDIIGIESKPETD